MSCIRIFVCFMIICWMIEGGFGLDKNDPKVDSKWNKHLMTFQHTIIAIYRTYYILLASTKGHCSNSSLPENQAQCGLWVGFVLHMHMCLVVKSTLHNRLTWLKKRLKQLGLHRRGPAVTYSPVPAVMEAIKVTIKNWSWQMQDNVLQWGGYGSL